MLMSDATKFGKFARLLGAMLAGGFSLPAPGARRRPTGKALRNPADPHQAARIQAAADKRARKAAKPDRDLNRSATWNGAHRAYPSDPVAYGSNFIWNRLNPFFINR